MNLIDRYIAEVGKHLPRKNRADIEAEIRSTLEDMLDERTQGKGTGNEAKVMQLLKEYGAPRDVAATYRPPQYQYLIGPGLFPIFERVIRIVLAVVVGASLIGLGVGLAKTGFTGSEFVSTLGEWFGGLLSGLIAAFGNIVLVFAIIERTHAAKEIQKEFEKESKDWNPEELKSEPDPDKVDLADHIATLIFTILGLIVLNLYPSLIAVRYLNDGTWVAFPVLTAAFFSFLPWINIMGLVQIIFSGFMLGQRTWTFTTRIVGILVDIAQMILAIAILRTPGIFGITTQTLTSIGFGEDAENLSRLFNSLPSLIILIVAIATSVKVIKALLRLFNRPRSPYPVLK